MTQEEAYKACLELASKNNWCACYNAMAEDGFDPSVNWLDMHKKWTDEAKK
jgi:hypothetical protein